MDPELDLNVLDSMTRDELVAKARELGVKRPEVMTRVELRDEIVRLSEPDVVAQRRSRGWLGVARDLVASVVESGLNMRDAAAAIRGEQRADQDFVGPPPVATVTLAEIYVAQGHPDRARRILDEVLAREPDHESALALRARLESEQAQRGERRRRAPEPEPGVFEDSPLASPAAVAAEAAPPAGEPDEHAAAPAATVREVHVTAPAPVPARAPEPSVLRECLLVRSPAGCEVLWNLGAVEGPFCLRVVAFVPRTPAPECIEREIELAQPSGARTLEGIPERAIVRAVVGRQAGEAFRPLAVAAVVSKDAEGNRRTLYRPPGLRSVRI